MSTFIIIIFTAEGAVLESIDKMEALKAIDVADFDWMMSKSRKVNNNLDLFEYWVNDQKTAEDAVPEAATVCANTEFVTVHQGVPAGSSLDMSKPTTHAFAVYGRSNNRGLVMIKVGYMKEY